MSTDLHITIVAAGDNSAGFALTHDIDLVKAAVLYADRVTLASPRTNMVAMIGSFSALSERDKSEAMRAMTSQMSQGQDIRSVYETLKRKRHKSRQELIAIKTIERKLSEAAEELEATTAQMADDAGFGELLPLIEEGILDLDLLGVEEDGDTSVMIDRLTELISSIVAPESTTFPMFDDGSGGLLHGMLNEGLIPNAHLARTTQTAIAARFIGWLPAFPAADLDSVMNARHSLRDPLVRYRSAVIRLTRELRSTRIDDDFEQAVHDLHQEHVEPALLEIEELTEELGLKESATRLIESGSGRRVAEAAVSFAASDIAGLPPALLASLGVSADLAAQVLRERRQTKRSQRENQFYFLYEADRKLASNA
jgi:hypothetical protein